MFIRIVDSICLFLASRSCLWRIHFAFLFDHARTKNSSLYVTFKGSILSLTICSKISFFVLCVTFQKKSIDESIKWLNERMFPFISMLSFSSIQELLSRTPESHPDYQNLSKALQMIEMIAEHVNKSVKEAERLRLLENLLKKNFIGLEVWFTVHYKTKTNSFWFLFDWLRLILRFPLFECSNSWNLIDICFWKVNWRRMWNLAMANMIAIIFLYSMTVLHFWERQRIRGKSKWRWNLIFVGFEREVKVNLIFSLSFVSFQKHYHLFESFQFYDLKLSDCSATIEVVTPENVVQITTTKESKKMWFEEIDKAVKDWLARRKMLLGM